MITESKIVDNKILTEIDKIGRMNWRNFHNYDASFLYDYELCLI